MGIKFATFLSLCVFILICHFGNPIFALPVSGLLFFSLVLINSIADMNFEKRLKLYGIQVEYNKALTYLVNNPEDPNIRIECVRLGELFYVTRNPNITTLELQNFLQNDFGMRLGHLSYC
jgi:hypothetical protein